MARVWNVQPFNMSNLFATSEMLDLFVQMTPEQIENTRQVFMDFLDNNQPDSAVEFLNNLTKVFLINPKMDK